MRLNRKEKGEVICNWWKSNLEQKELPNARQFSNSRARGLGARLRRADPISALSESVVHDLVGDLQIFDGELIARLVVLLAHIEKDVGNSLPSCLGKVISDVVSSEGKAHKKRLYSETRFQKLLRAQGEELTDLFRRALIAAKRECNVGEFGADILEWFATKEDLHAKGGVYGREPPRVTWCFEYYGTKNSNLNVEETSKEISE